MEAGVKIAGIVSTVVGVLVILFGVMIAIIVLNLGFTKYDLNSSHDLIKHFVGIGLTVLVILGGIVLIKSRSDEGKGPGADLGF